MIRSQEEERGKVIDDVLVILQTLLKRTDSLQSLVCTGDLLDHPAPWAPQDSQCHFGFEGLPRSSQLRNMNWEKVDIIDYENFLSLGRAFSLTLRLSN
jgi:hypothetical protein